LRTIRERRDKRGGREQPQRRKQRLQGERFKGETSPEAALRVSLERITIKLNRGIPKVWKI